MNNLNTQLKEPYRVLKPSGKAIFLEYMKSHHGLVNIPLYLMNVLSTRLLGTSMIRETQKNIELAGFTIESAEYKVLGIVIIKDYQEFTLTSMYFQCIKFLISLASVSKHYL